MGISIGELFIDLGFDVDDKKIKDFNSTLSTTLNDMLKLAGISASAAGFISIMNGASEASVKLRNMNAELNISSQAAQKWAAVVHQVNPLISIDQALDGVSRLQKALSDISQGKGPSGALARLAGKNVAGMGWAEVLDAISENKASFMRENGVNATSIHSQLMDQVFGGSGWERAMDLTGTQRDQMGDRMVVEQANLDKLDHLADKMAVLGELWDKLIKDTAANLAPTASGFIDSLSKGGVKGAIDWIGEHSYLPGMVDSIGEHSYLPGLIEWAGKHNLTDWATNGLSAIGKNMDESRNAGIARRFFESQGHRPEVAAGMVDRLMKESYAHLDHTAVGDGGKAYGVAQWHPERQKDFKDVMGKDIRESSFMEQLQFIEYELTKGKERKAGALLDKSSSRLEAENTFRTQYERPASNNNKPTVIQNNKTSIQSTAPASELKRQWDTLTQGNLNNAYSEFNLGPVY